MRIRILSVLCLSILAAFLGAGVLVPILPLYAKGLGASGTVFGVIFSSFALTLAISNPLVGKISDRIGYKPMIALGLGIHIPVALLYVIATKPYHLIIIRLAEGPLAAMVVTVAMAYVGSIAPKDKEGSYMGIFGTALFLGLGLGPLMGGYLTDAYNIRTPFYAMAALLAVSFILVLLLLPRRKGSPASYKKNDSEAAKRPIKEALRSDLMKGMLLFSLIIAIGQSGLMVFLPLMAQGKQMTTTQIGILSAVIVLMAGGLQIPFGYFANRYNKVFLLIAGVLIISVILAYIPLCSSFYFFLALSVMGGVGSAMANPAATAMLVRESKTLGIGLGFALGLYNFAFGLGMIAGPFLSGLIMDIFSLDKVFYANSAIFVLASTVIYQYTKGLKDI